MQTVEGPLERTRPSNILGGGLRASVGEWWKDVIDDRARRDAALIAAYRWVAARMHQEAPSGALEKRCSVWTQGAVPNEDELRAAFREDGWEVELNASLRIVLVRARWLDDLEFEITLSAPRLEPRRGAREVWRAKMLISLEQQEDQWRVTSATLVTTATKSLLPCSSDRNADLNDHVRLHLERPERG
jgi:hypothetical protein